jgi:hypothetical protein
MGFQHLVALQSFDREGKVHSLHTMPSLNVMLAIVGFIATGIVCSAFVMKTAEAAERGKNVAIARVAQEYPPLAAIWLGMAFR